MCLEQTDVPKVIEVYFSFPFRNETIIDAVEIFIMYGSRHGAAAQAARQLEQALQPS